MTSLGIELQHVSTNYATLVLPLTAVNSYYSKSSIFCGITPCSQLKVNGRFGGTCHLHLHGQRISQAKNQRESLFFDPEGGRDKFLKKRHSTFNELHDVIEDRTTHDHWCENLKSYSSVLFKFSDSNFIDTFDISVRTRNWLEHNSFQFHMLSSYVSRYH
jgi:hypothetical protein